MCLSTIMDIIFFFLLSQPDRGSRQNPTHVGAQYQVDMADGSEEGAAAMDLHEKLEQIEATKRRLTARRVTYIGKALCISVLD